MGLGSFGVQRLLKFVTGLKKDLSTTTILFFVLDMLLQCALVGTILWIVLIVVREYTFNNWIIVMVASILAGIVSAIIDTRKIFTGKSNMKVGPLEESDKTKLYCYIALFILYVGLAIFMYFNLIGK